MEKFPILISYAYLRKAKPAVIEWWTSQPDIEVLLDSGAFTAWSTGAPIQVEDYIAFLKDWGHKFWNYFALDVVKEPKPTRENLYKMWDAGLIPIPVHVFGEGEAWMNELYRHTDYIATVVRQQMGDGERFINRILKLKMKWAAGRKVHWFGYTRKQQLNRYQPYSCDCSSWLQAARYGLMNLYLGGGRWKGLRLQDTKAKAISREIVHVIQKYGFSMSDLYDPDLWRRNLRKGIPCEQHMSYQVTVRSWIDYVIDVYKHMKTRLFLAVEPCSEDAKQLFRQLRGLENINVPWIGKGEPPDESSSTRVRRTGQHGAPLPSGKGEARGGLRIVRRLRPATRTGARFRQEGLLDVGDSD